MTTWILLRGLSRESRHWDTFPSQLGAALGNPPVFALDLPGAGPFNHERSPTRVEEIAASCRDRAISLGLKPPFNLVGLSLGAMVAVAWAAQRPEDVSACVLINTSLGGRCAFWQRLRPRNYPTLLRLAVPGSLQAQESKIFDMTCRKTDDRKAVTARWVAIRRERPVSTGNTLRQLVAAIRYRPHSRPPAKRLLILGSAGDTLVDPQCSRRLAQDWQADYFEHPSAGHDLPQDDGAWVVRQIADWWKGA